MSEAVEQEVMLAVENIGGIDETTVRFTPGVTILSGRNATNRTSLLQALMAAFGSDQFSLKSNADEGSVTLTIGDQTYTRTVRRQNGQLVTNGDPYLEDTTIVDLFAFLLESNEARRAVARGDELRDLIMHPVDTDQIDRHISQYQEERSDIDDEIEEISKLQSQLPRLEGQKEDIKDDIGEKRDEISEIQDEIDNIDEDIESKKEEKDKLESRLEELSDVRSSLESTRQQLRSHEESIDALEHEQSEVEEDLESLDAVPEERIEELDDELDHLHTHRSDLDDTIDRLQTVIRFNEDLLDDDLDLFTDIFGDDSDAEPLTDQLVEDEDDLVCWTCGGDVTTDQIESMLDRLREVHREKMEERNDLDEQISTLRTNQSELEEQRRQRRQLQSRLDGINEEIDEHRDRISGLETKRDDLVDEVEALEDEIETLRTDDEQDELIELHKEANQLEVDVGRLESDLAEVTDEIARIEDRVDDRDQLEAQRDELQEEIESLRTRIDRLEAEAIETFNNHMDTVLDLLEYNNLDRIWLERTERQQREGRRNVTKSSFELHIVRSTADGAVYEDTVDNLSESEREVTGFVFALAGYLAHDVYEELPFMLLDSVEAIDSQRLADLIEHFTNYSEYLVAALLEEDARALDDSYQRITDL